MPNLVVPEEFPSHDREEGRKGTTVRSLQTYCLDHAEQIFCLAILITAPVINYLIPYKLIFLNSYFIIILVGTHYLETRKALLGGILSTLLITLYAYYFPHYFRENLTDLDMWMNLLAWTGFLILATAIVGRLINGLKQKVKMRETALQEMERYAGQVELLATRLAHMNSEPLNRKS